MSKQEVIRRELGQLPEADLDLLVAFLRALREAHTALREAHTESEMPTVGAESALAKDWLTPEEDAAWASL